MTAPVFFLDRVNALLDLADLDGAAEMILDASRDKEFGAGPPEDELNKARRNWLAEYEREVAR